jgi:hypothetical protein
LFLLIGQVSLRRQGWQSSPQLPTSAPDRLGSISFIATALTDLVRNDWEERRTEAKARVDVLFDMLDANEKAFVVRHVKNYIAELKPTSQATGAPVRTLGRKRSVSLSRSTSAPVPGEVSGGAYLASQQTRRRPTVGPPDATEDIGLYVTQPFRNLRR